MITTKLKRRPTELREMCMPDLLDEEDEPDRAGDNQGDGEVGQQRHGQVLVEVQHHERLPGTPDPGRSARTGFALTGKRGARDASRATGKIVTATRRAVLSPLAVAR